ncbi:hypothetical protein BH11PSE11_BH11PSE11_34850 [soil metagenome]
MRIANLSVLNFKAIRRLELQDLQDTIVVAGPNGCGKSCVFDAIRLVKSTYGGYQANEWQSWMGEQAINLSRDRADTLRLLQDPTKSLCVTADFVASKSEVRYLTENAVEVCRDHLWRDQPQQRGQLAFMASNSLAASMRTYQPKVESDAKAMAAELVEELREPTLKAQLTIDPKGEINALRSIALEVIFSRYDPQNVGIIDYHSSTRNYGRQQIDNVNLSIDTSNNHLRQHALYNSSNKYSNLKTEMASSFVRQLLIDKAVGSKDSLSLGETLDELFTTFFPGKKFLGPQPTAAGQLLFQVLLPNGASHDIDELSAGEKEVLYGYLRLRNSTPWNSMILIDEPELHLNPRLISGLAGFYHKHISRAKNNQLWLVTHSDTLIREAVDSQGFSVFHMQPAAQSFEENQATNVQIRQDLDRLVIDLIGDLAAYRPAAKIVVFEGGGNSDFDVRLVAKLFPEFARVTNCISGGNKRRVSQLYELLESARSAGHISGSFYAVTDSDDDMQQLRSSATTWTWPVYHIENFLLEPNFILKVLEDLGMSSDFHTGPSAILRALEQCAEKTIPKLVRHRLLGNANRTVQRAAELRLDHTRVDIASDLSETLDRAIATINSEVSTKLSPALLKGSAAHVETTTRAQLESGEWRDRFRGRDVLRVFVGKYGGGIAYEAFCDLIVARMRDAEYQPIGMGKILNAILVSKPAT